MAPAARPHHRPWHEANSPRSARQGQTTRSTVRHTRLGEVRCFVSPVQRAGSRHGGGRGGPERYHGVCHGQQQTANPATPLLGILTPSASRGSCCKRHRQSRRPATLRERRAGWRTGKLQGAGHAARLTRGCDAGLRRAWKGGEGRWKNAYSA